MRCTNKTKRISEMEEIEAKIDQEYRLKKSILDKIDEENIKVRSDLEQETRIEKQEKEVELELIRNNKLKEIKRLVDSKEESL